MKNITCTTIAWEAPLDAFKDSKKGDTLNISVKVRIKELNNVAYKLVAKVNKFEFNLIIGSLAKGYEFEAKLSAVDNVPVISNIHKVNDINNVLNFLRS